MSRFGCGAEGLVRATNYLFTAFSTRYHGTPQAKLLKTVRKALRAKCHMISVDAASDELLASELSRRPLMELFGTLTPNCGIVLRDKAHASRRTATRVVGER